MEDLSNPPSPKSPYQPQAGLIGIIFGAVGIRGVAQGSRCTGGI